MNHTEPTPPSPRTIVESFFAELTGGQLERAIARCAPDAVWAIPGDPALLPWVGEHHGRDEIRAFYGLLAAEAQAESLQLDPIAELGERCFVRGEFAYSFPRSGGRYAGVFVIVFTVRDGLIARYEMHEDSLGLARAFTGPEGPR